MQIPCFPELAPLELGMKDEMAPELAGAPDGVSEFSFSGLYLFRKRYGYQVTRIRDARNGENRIVISGLQPDGGMEGKRFFSTPDAVPDRATLDALFTTHGYWKNIPSSILEALRDDLPAWGVTTTEDRDNFDYLYLREELAALSGKRFHKKKNLVNLFEKTYASFESRPLSAAAPDLVPLALDVLDRWRADNLEKKGDEGDYAASRDALEHIAELGMTGSVVIVEGRPAGYCLGDYLAGGTMFDTHFEKGIEDYKGIYQYVNMAFAQSLPASVVHLNREQDLGEEGLRQAKESYRPVGFVKKWMGARS